MVHRRLGHTDVAWYTKGWDTLIHKKLGNTAINSQINIILFERTLLSVKTELNA